ncbi:MAG TPA: tetratricopeptide repeat protein [Bacteroidetes bacterium]|nr:tetratricopeptide repeat protein [Bacteroidota bacterium]
MSMKKITGIISICVAVLLFAPSGTGQLQTDSLKVLLKASKKGKKLEILHQLTRLSLSTDPKKAIDYGKEAARVARSVKKPEEEALALQNIAKAYFFLGDYANAQKQYFASLKIYQELGDKQGIANTLNNLGVLCRSKGDYSKALDYYNKSLELKKILEDKQGIANTLNNIGEIHKFRGEYPEAIRNYRESYTLKKELGDKKWMANTLNNLGEIFSIWGDYQEALKYYLEASTLWSNLNNLQGMAGAYHNIAGIYESLNNYSQAEKYYLEALRIQEKLGDKSHLAATLRELGNVFIVQGKYEAADTNFSRSLLIEQELNNVPGVAATLENMGELYFKQNLLDSALRFFDKTLSLYRQTEDMRGMASCYSRIGETYWKKGEEKKAEGNYFKSLVIARDLNILRLIQNDYLGLARIYQQQKDYKKALDYFFKYLEIKDTLMNVQIHQQIAELETKYQTRQKEKELLLKDEQLRRKDLEIEKQNLQRNVILAGLVFVLLIAVLIFRNYRQKKKANEILRRQKEEIELKNKEITDSIRYARYIQRAFMPHEKYVHEIFRDIFIFFRPKDIVSGDFYWIGKSGRYAYVAAVDATGHGVPGAFLSLLGYNLLNMILKENPEIKPNEIMDELNKGFSERMFKEYQKRALRDSMDLALCRINMEKGILNYSGAYNPLWIARNEEMIVIKGDKFPIGSYLENPKTQYADHEVMLEENDVIYLFSDGYADQFGGPNGKKFKYTRMKELLLKISKEDLKKQKDILEQTMEEWMGVQEQVDDMLIIGFKVTRS